MNTRFIVASLIMLSAVAFGHSSASARARIGTPQAASALVTSHATLTAVETSPEYIVPMLVIVAPRSMPRAKVWACGPVEANRVGGSQRTCEWL